MRTISLAVLILAVSACTRQESAPATTAAPSQAWASTRDALIEEYLKARPAFAVYQGRHEFDGQLPDWSADGIAAEVKRLHAARDRAAAVSGLSGAERVRARLPGQRSSTTTCSGSRRAAAVHATPRSTSAQLDPSPYLTRNYAPLEQRMRAYIAYARADPAAAAQIRANLRTPLAQPLAERGISGFGGYADFYKTTWPRCSPTSRTRRCRRNSPTPMPRPSKAMARSRRLAEGAARRPPRPATRSAPSGSRKMLRATEGVDTPLAELEAAAGPISQRNQQALARPATRYAPGATIAACIAKMAAQQADGRAGRGRARAARRC